MFGIREIVNAIPNLPPKVSTSPIWNLSGQMLATKSVVFTHRHASRDSHRVHDLTRQIANWRGHAPKPHHPVPRVRYTTNGWLADNERAQTPERIGGSPVV